MLTLHSWTQINKSEMRRQCRVQLCSAPAPPSATPAAPAIGIASLFFVFVHLKWIRILDRGTITFQIRRTLTVDLGTWLCKLLRQLYIHYIWFYRWTIGTLINPKAWQQLQLLKMERRCYLILQEAFQWNSQHFCNSAPAFVHKHLLINNALQLTSRDSEFKPLLWSLKLEIRVVNSKPSIFHMLGETSWSFDSLHHELRASIPLKETMKLRGIWVNRGYERILSISNAVMTIYLANNNKIYGVYRKKADAFTLESSIRSSRIQIHLSHYPLVH